MADSGEQRDGVPGRLSGASVVVIVPAPCPHCAGQCVLDEALDLSGTDWLCLQCARRWPVRHDPRTGLPVTPG